MTSASDSFQAAVRFHRAGQLAEAEQLYRQVLRAEPRHADALCLLGLLARQAGDHELAIQHLTQAIAINDTQPAYHNDLGEAYRATQRLAEAETCYQNALRLSPTYAPTHHNLGLLLQAKGELAAAQRQMEQAVLLDPLFAEAHNSLGLVLQSQGKLNEALAAYRAAQGCRPTFAEALNNLGSALVALERFPEAIDELKNLLRIRPELPECRYNLGSAYLGWGRFVEAAGCFRDALRLRPDYLAARAQLALALQRQGDLTAAAANYREALRMKPDWVEALNNYATLLDDQGQFDESLAMHDRAIALRPDFARAHFNRANLYRHQDMAAKAIAGYQEALRLQPGYAAASTNLAILFNDVMEPDKAAECCRKALDLGADLPLIRATMATALLASGRADEAVTWYRQSLEMEDDPVQHSNLLYALNFTSVYDPPTTFAEHLAWARQYAEPLTARAEPHANDRASERRLRIGYISSHFREHAVNFFFEPLLASHDHERFEIFCYADVKKPDVVTARLRAAADHSRDVRPLSDEQIARVVRYDRIDILVDLTGHIGENRLLVFARKPAPIQVTYLGYQNTTGMSAMDYRFTDELADPIGLGDPYYTERLVRLPRSFFCYRPSDDSPSVTPLPVLASGHVTFGSFNNVAKITPEAIAAWLEILARVPRSRLIVLARRGGYIDRRLGEVARSRKIDPARIEVCNRRSRLDFLRLIQRSDIALDPFAFNGHTTTCDAIWMGVPVVMLAGKTYATRFGGSVLANVGLERLIASTAEQYVDVAVELANDRPGLAQLRRGLRGQMAASAILDFHGFTRNVEAAYRQMWIEWCGAH